MRYLTLILILATIFLSSCSIDWNDEKNKKIQELEKQVLEIKQKDSEDLFKKKQDCNKEYDRIIKDENDPENVDASTTIDSIFFSPKQNTCMYAITRVNYYHSGKPDADTWTWFIIKDAYTHELIYTSKMIAINKEGMAAYDNKEEVYNNKIKELKGE